MADQHPPQLALDIGNTTTKAAVWQNGVLGEVLTWPTGEDWRPADDLVTNLGVQNIIFSTVANVPPPAWRDKRKAAGQLVVGLREGLPLPFTSRYRTMATLGQDRIAAVAGGLWLRPDPAPAPPPPLLIADAGTCLTLDLIDSNRVYHGGNISPGLRMRLRAMYELTARLPLISEGNPAGLVGDSTSEALRHGAQRGLVYEVEGLYQRLRAQYPDLQLYLTGGDGPFLHAQLSVPCVFNPNLVLLGLHYILSDYVRIKS